MCLLAAAVLSGNSAVALPAKAAVEAAVQKDASMVLRGSVLVVTGNGALTQTAKEVLGKDKLSLVTEIRVESGVTQIGPQAFRDMESVKTITLPQGLTAVGSFAFYRCRSLSEAVLPDSVTSLGAGAFQECTGLTRAVLGEGITKIPIQLFRGCQNLEKVSLGSRVEELGEQCFYLCSSLKELRLPDSVVQVEKNAFTGCRNLNLIKSQELEDQGDGTYRKRGGLRIQGTFLYSEAEKMLSMVNQKRISAGLAPLTMDRELLDAAMTRSAELNVLYSDQRPNGAGFDSVSSKAASENRLIGTFTARDALEIWMESGGYRGRILDAGIKSIGIGCFSQGKNRCWILLFGRQEAEKAETQPDRSGTVDIRAANGTYSFYLKDISLELKAGESRTIQVLMKNSGFSQAPAVISPDTFVWRSSDPAVAQVDEKGIVTPKKGGKAVITCTSRYGDRQELSCEVKVRVNVSSIKAETGNLRLAIGKKYTVKPLVLPVTASDKSLQFRSSRPSVVSVDEEGTLRAKKKGTAVITCAARDGSGVKTSFTVTVKNYASRVRILNNPVDMTVGERVLLKAQVIPSDAVNKRVVYQSSDKKIASVNEKGLVKALRPGKVKITCRARYGAGTDRTITITIHPKAPALRAKTSGNATVLTWNKPVGAKLFSLYRADRPNGSFKRVYRGTGNKFTQKGLKKGKTYYFKIRCAAKVDKKYINSAFSPVLEVKAR